MRAGTLVKVIDTRDVNYDKLGVVTYLINREEVEVWCQDEPWIYLLYQLEVCSEVS